MTAPPPDVGPRGGAAEKSKGKKESLEDMSVVD